MLCTVLDLPPDQILRFAGLPASYDTADDRGLTGQELMTLWDSASSLSERPDFPVTMGISAARGPFVPAVFAFSCSPDIRTGLERLAVFKPIIGPMRMTLTQAPEGLMMALHSAPPDLEIPPCLSLFELSYFVELMRYYSGRHVVPVAATMPDAPNDALSRHLGVSPGTAPVTSLTISHDDAAARLITENPRLWEVFEKDLQRQLDLQTRGGSTGARVRAALLEALPAGDASVAAVARVLGTSARSLQRRLSGEGTTFQKVLDATRTELAVNYLTKTRITVEEISFLLAYRDPNSFYRAFQTWTGLTPGEMRSRLQ